MNKQEAIEKLKSRVKSHWLDEEIYGDNCIKSVELGMAIDIVNQIDEPEKPVVPQFVADMIIKRKTAGQSVIKAIENLRFYEDACKWVRNNGETFVKAWLKEEERMTDVREVTYFNDYDEVRMILDAEGYYLWGEFELMQSTGLKDIHDKDIYVGDIIKYKRYPYGFAYIGVVGYNTIGLIQKDDEIGLILTFAGMGVENIDLRSLEVIGNIYENSELLGEEE